MPRLGESLEVSVPGQSYSPLRSTDDSVEVAAGGAAQSPAAGASPPAAKESTPSGGSASGGAPTPTPLHWFSPLRTFKTGVRKVMHGRALGRATPACTGPHSSTQVAVGWQGVPDADQAQAYRQQHMAVYTKTVLPPPLDKQVIDMNKPYTHYKTSWDDGADDHRQRMHTFGLWSTTATEVGQIGGVGYRLYFEVLGWIRYLFLLLAIANTPSLYLNLTCCGVDADGSAVDNMYDSRNITDLDRLSLVPLPDSLSQFLPGETTPWGPRSTLGSVRADIDDLNAGRVHSLWIRTVCDSLSCALIFTFAWWMGSRLPRIASEADNSTINMSDYAVSIRPRNGPAPMSPREKALRKKIVLAEQAKLQLRCMDPPPFVPDKLTVPAVSSTRKVLSKRKWRVAHTTGIGLKVVRHPERVTLHDEEQNTKTTCLMHLSGTHLTLWEADEEWEPIDSYPFVRLPVDDFVSPVATGGGLGGGLTSQFAIRASMKAKAEDSLHQITSSGGADYAGGGAQHSSPRMPIQAGATWPAAYFKLLFGSSRHDRDDVLSVLKDPAMYLRAAVSMHADRLLHVGNVDDRLLAPGDTSLSDKLLGLFTKFGVVIAVTVRHRKTDEGVSWALVCFDKHEMAVRALDAAGDKKFQELVVKQLDVTKAMYSTGAMGQTLRHHFEQIDAATLKRKDARQRLSAAVDLSHHEHGEAEDASAEQVDQATRLHKWLTEVPLFRALIQNCTAYRSSDASAGEALRFTEALAKSMESRTFKPRTVILAKGGISAEIVFPYTGQCEVLLELEDTPIKVLGPGAFFGERAFLSGVPSSAHVRSKQNVHAFVLPRAKLDNLLAKHQAIAEVFHRTVDEVQGSDAMTSWDEDSLLHSVHQGMHEESEVRETTQLARSVTTGEIKELLKLNRSRGGWVHADEVLLVDLRVLAGRLEYERLTGEMKSAKTPFGWDTDSSIDPRTQACAKILGEEMEQTQKQLRLLNGLRVQLGREHATTAAAADQHFRKQLLRAVEQHGAVARSGGKPCIWIVYAADGVASAATEKVELFQLLEISLARGASGANSLGVRSHQSRPWAAFGGVLGTRSSSLDESEICSLVKDINRIDADILSGCRSRGPPVQVFVAYEHATDANHALGNQSDDPLEAEDQYAWPLKAPVTSYRLGVYNDAIVELQRPHEPEDYKFGNLDVFEREQKIRDAGVNVCTALFLAGLCILMMPLLLVDGGEADYLTSCEHAISLHGYCDPFRYEAGGVNRSSGYSRSGNRIAAAEYYRRAFDAAAPTTDAPETGLEQDFPRIMLANDADVERIRVNETMQSAEACRSVCAATEHCDFFSFEVDQSGHQCYLKVGYPPGPCAERPYTPWANREHPDRRGSSGPACRAGDPSDNVTDCAFWPGMDYGGNPIGSDGQDCGYAEIIMIIADRQLGDGSIEWFAGERECHPGVPGCCSRADSDTWATANAADCHRVDRSSTVYPWGDRDALCYMCLCNCQRTSATDDEHCAKTAIERTVPGFCDSFRAWEDVTEHWKLLASMFTVVVNYAARRFVWQTARFGKAHLLGSERIMVAMRILVVQVINTAVLVALLRMDTPALDSFISSLLNFLPGVFISSEKFDSVNAKWYSVVGTPLIATTVANFLMPIVECWVSALQARARRGAVLRRVGARLCCQMAGSAADVAYTQTQLNRWHESPPWNVAVGFSEMLLNIFVILLYSSGIPILYWVGAVGFSAKYWSDKYFMLRVAQRNVHSEVLITRYSIKGILLVALALHMCAGAVFYAFAGGTDPAKPAHANLTRPHMWPLLATMMSLVLIHKLGVCAIHQLSQLRRRQHSRQNSLPPFSEAFDAGRIVNIEDDYERDELQVLEAWQRGFAKSLGQEEDAQQRNADKLEKEFASHLNSQKWFADREAFLAGSHDTSLAKAHAAYAGDSGVEALEPAMPTPIIALLKSINLETADGMPPAPSTAAAEAGEEQFCNAMDGDSPGALQRQLSRLQKRVKTKTLF